MYRAHIYSIRDFGERHSVLHYRGNIKTSIKMRFDMFALALKTYFAVCSYSSICFFATANHPVAHFALVLKLPHKKTRRDTYGFECKWIY